MTYYSIPSEKCSSDALKDIPTGVSQETTWMSKLVKTLLIVLWVLVWGFIIVVIVFAVKSRLTKKEEETEEI
jgi:heme/copper-type cytochrome/quinol oxidase subunit 2